MNKKKTAFVTLNWQKGHYLVEGVLKKQGKKLNNWKLRTGLNPPQVNTDKQAQKICELFQVTARWKRKKIRNMNEHLS